MGFLVPRDKSVAVDFSRDTPLLTSTLAAGIGADIAYLYRLQDGRTGVVMRVLELSMDSDLAMLGERLAALPADQRDPQQLQIIKMHKEYREKFPYSNSIPAVVEGVQKAYGLVPEPSRIE